MNIGQYPYLNIKLTDRFHSQGCQSCKFWPFSLNLAVLPSYTIYTRVKHGVTVMTFLTFLAWNCAKCQENGGFSKFFREEHALDPASMSSCLQHSAFPASVRFLSFTGWQVCIAIHTHIHQLTGFCIFLVAVTLSTTLSEPRPKRLHFTKMGLLARLSLSATTVAAAMFSCLASFLQRLTPWWCYCAVSLALQPPTSRIWTGEYLSWMPTGWESSNYITRIS